MTWSFTPLERSSSFYKRVIMISVVKIQDCDYVW